MLEDSGSHMIITNNENLEIAKELSNYCAVFLKGGHNEENIGTDYLLINEQITILKPSEVLSAEKHGSGCVLSSAIAAYLSLDETLENACRKAKLYTEKILQSNLSKLAYHV